MPAQLRCAPGGGRFGNCGSRYRRSCGRNARTRLDRRWRNRDGAEGHVLLYVLVQQQRARRQRRRRTAEGVGEEAEQQHESKCASGHNDLPRHPRRRAPASHRKQHLPPAIENRSQRPSRAGLRPRRPSGDVIHKPSVGLLRRRRFGSRSVLRRGSNDPRERHAFPPSCLS